VQDVCITGAGVVSPIGCGYEAFGAALFASQAGIVPLELFDTDGLRSTIAGVVTADPASMLGAKGLRYLSRSTQWLQCATLQAIDDAGLTGETDRDQWALIVGTAFGSLRSISEFDHESLRNGPSSVNPMSFPNTVVNAPAGQTAIRFGLRGPNITISAGSASGLSALAYGASLIRAGLADCVLAGGAEELCEASFRGFDRGGKLAASVDLAEPFVQSGAGFILGEGAAMLVLESAERASRRGAPVLASITGCGEAFGAGAGARSIGLAFDAAAATVDDIDAIVSGANGSDHDVCEGRDITALFGAPPRAPGYALAPATGETLGAAGALSTLAACHMIAAQAVPPTVRAAGAAGSADLDGFLQPVGRHARIARVLVTAAAPEGHHAALVIEQTASSGEARAHGD
jgi:3-oxoacyl-[acyl-carrier-protein] synthase II